VLLQEEDAARRVQSWMSAANLRCYRTPDVIGRVFQLHRTHTLLLYCFAPHCQVRFADSIDCLQCPAVFGRVIVILRMYRSRLLTVVPHAAVPVVVLQG